MNEADKLRVVLASEREARANTSGTLQERDFLKGLVQIQQDVIASLSPALKRLVHHSHVVDHIISTDCDEDAESVRKWRLAIELAEVASSQG